VVEEEEIRVLGFGEVKREGKVVREKTMATKKLNRKITGNCLDIYGAFFYEGKFTGLGQIPGSAILSGRIGLTML